MPKYIKDGAYTIVVNEVAASPKRPLHNKDNDSDSDEEEFDEPSNEQINTEIDNIAWGAEEDEDQNEEIDYTDPAFILKDLSISAPNFKKDNTGLLSGRKELADIIASQVRFYIYCTIDAFSRNPRVASILVIGEGFIGARIINDLLENGCKDMLRVCTRGDLTAEEWRTKGIKADNNLLTLLNGVAPDIIILSVENSSFTGVCRQLTSNYIITPSTMIISCSFGFQRRKLYTQLRTPHILRTFVEPEEILSNYKKTAFNSILAFTKSGKQTSTPSFSVPSMKKTETLPSGVTNKNEFNGASYMATRTLDIRNLIYQFENYYAVQHHGFADARWRALKNILGCKSPPPVIEGSIEAIIPAAVATLPRKASADETFEQMSIRKALKTEAKLKAKLEFMLRKLSTYNGCIHTYQQYFSELVTTTELNILQNKTYTKEENLPKNDQNIGFMRHRAHVQAIQRHAVPEKPGKSMYNDDFIEDLFRYDEDYRHYTGPGFDLMRNWDKTIDSNWDNSSKFPVLNSSSCNSSIKSKLHTNKNRITTTNNNKKVIDKNQNELKKVVGKEGMKEVGKQGMKEVVVDEELVEYGKRMSSRADIEGVAIDRNYMQQYLEASSKGFT